MKHTCTTCDSSFYFGIMDEQMEWTIKDNIMHMTILWECPVCWQTNELKGYFPYTPRETHEFPMRGMEEE